MPGALLDLIGGLTLGPEGIAGAALMQTDGRRGPSFQGQHGRACRRRHGRAIAPSG